MIHFRPWKLNITKDEIIECRNKDVNIWQASMCYILQEWIKLYESSPFYIEDYSNLIDRNSTSTYHYKGLKSSEKHGPFKLNVFQEHIKGKIRVSFWLKKVCLIVKERIPGENSKIYILRGEKREYKK